MIEGEENLVQGAKKGDTAAFGALYDHYVPRIYRFVFLKVGRKEDAEDLTHEIFVRAFEHIKDYRQKGFPFSSWLYRIARNAIIDRYRGRRQTVDIDAVSPEELPALANVETRAEQAILLQKVSGAIGALKPEHQDVIIMRFVEELSVKETAEAMGRSEGAVKLLQHRAIKELRTKLGKEENNGNF